MDLKENWRAWHSNLCRTSAPTDQARCKDSREVTCRFLVLVLLFCQVTGEGDDVNIDLLCAGASGLAIAVAVGGHLAKLLVTTCPQLSKISLADSEGR